MAKSRGKGEGSIYKEGLKFFFKIRIDGKTKTKLLRNEDNSPCKNMTEAIKSANSLKPILFATTKQEIAVHVAEAKKIIKAKNSFPVNEVWKRFLEQPNRPDSSEATLKNHNGILNIFIQWLKDNHPNIRQVSQIDFDCVKEFFVYYWNTGISAKRYNDVILSLNLIFKHILESSGLEENYFGLIVKKPKEIESRQEFTEEQIKDIFNGFKTGFFYTSEYETLTTGRIRQRYNKTIEFQPMHKSEMYVLLNLCCWTGCRGQDGCLMEWNNINFATNQIRYKPRKTAKKTGGKIVALPIHPQLKEALLTAQQWRDSSDYIMPNVANRYKSNPSGIQKDVMKIIRCATGLDTINADTEGRRKNRANRYSLHSFRHSFVSFCANSGVPLAIVAEIVGHGSPAMTKHYSHISEQSKSQAINALPTLTDISPLIATDPRQELKTIIDTLPLADVENILKILQK